MSRIYIFAASKMEADPVTALAESNGGTVSSNAERLQVGQNELTLIIGGMGPQLAKATASSTFGPWIGGSSTRFSQDKPDAVLVIGLCGGLTQSISSSRIVVYAKCLSTEPKMAPLDCSPAIAGRLPQLLGSRGIVCESVDGITSPRIAVRKADRLGLAAHGASVVDMETYEIVSAAGRAGVPAAVLRVVSDTVDWELPDFNQALNAQGALDRRKALGVALASPLRTYRLLLANKRAMRRLVEALAVVLAADWFTT
jgi:nucleoside phosphorylase